MSADSRKQTGKKDKVREFKGHLCVKKSSLTIVAVGMATNLAKDVNILCFPRRKIRTSDSRIR